MDVLESGSDRPARLPALARRVHPAAVAAGLVVVLLCGLLALGRVQSDLRAARDVSTVDVTLVVERTTRAGDGSTYGFARFEVADAAGRPVALRALDVDLPGVRLGPRTGARLGELVPAPRVVLPVRFAVPDCAELVLPGRLHVDLARPGQPGETVTVVVGPGGQGAAAAASLRRACGLPAG